MSGFDGATLVPETRQRKAARFLLCCPVADWAGLARAMGVHRDLATIYRNAGMYWLRRHAPERLADVQHWKRRPTRSFPPHHRDGH